MAARRQSTHSSGCPRMVDAQPAMAEAVTSLTTGLSAIEASADDICLSAATVPSLLSFQIFHFIVQWKKLVSVRYSLSPFGAAGDQNPENSDLVFHIPLYSCGAFIFTNRKVERKIRLHSLNRHTRRTSWCHIAHRPSAGAVATQPSWPLHPSPHARPRRGLLAEERRRLHAHY